jgi:hypothetical protein
LGDVLGLGNRQNTSGRKKTFTQAASVIWGH